MMNKILRLFYFGHPDKLPNSKSLFLHKILSETTYKKIEEISENQGTNVMSSIIKSRILTSGGRADQLILFSFISAIILLILLVFNKNEFFWAIYLFQYIYFFFFSSKELSHFGKTKSLLLLPLVPGIGNIILYTILTLSSKNLIPHNDPTCKICTTITEKPWKEQMSESYEKGQSFWGNNSNSKGSEKQKKISHILHAILTLATGGLWGIVWIALVYQKWSESYEKGQSFGGNDSNSQGSEKVLKNPFDELMSLSYSNTKEQGDIFEHFCAVLLDTLGYQIINIPGGAGDKGIDINVTTPGAIKTNIAVQCKSFPTSKVGTGDIQKTISLKTLAGQSIDKVALMTSGEFSRPALVMAQENQVDLFDGTRIKELSYEYFEDRTLEDINREGIKWRD